MASERCLIFSTNPDKARERGLFGWKQFEWLDFLHLTRRIPQSDALASVEDFDEVRAEKTPPKAG